MSKLGYNLHSGEVTILQKQKVHDFGRAARLNAFNKASALASAHGIKVEKDAAGGWWVDCNKFPADSDPLDGHHFCSDGHEVLSAVEIYVEVLTKAAQGHAQQAVGLLVVAHALRARQHGGVVGQDHGPRAFGSEHGAIDRSDAGHHAVGRCLGDQVGFAAPAALGRHGQRAVFDEAAGVAQVGDVLARGAHAQGTAPCHRFGAGNVMREGQPRLQSLMSWSS